MVLLRYAVGDLVLQPERWGSRDEGAGGYLVQLLVLA